MTPACRACGRPDAGGYATKHGYELFRCPDCGTIFVDPVPADVETFYDERYFTGAAPYGGYTDYDRDKEPMRRTFAGYLADLDRYVGRGRLLDVGAASGFFVRLALDAGWDAEGVEVSPYASSVARSRALRVREGTLERVDGAGTYDAVTMWDVLEHLPDPGAALRRVHELLRPGGLLAVTTPDSTSAWARAMGARWHMLIPPEHLTILGRPSIRTLLQSAGFRTLRVGGVTKRFSVPYVLRTLAWWQGGALARRLAEAADRPALRRLALPLNLRDNMYAIARKDP